jgi:ssDNA-binding Zn-finger/Zn-ribbon topoisomerase 1
MKCPECGAIMILKETQKFTNADGTPKKFYGCSRFPECTATHGAHPNGSPLSIPATQEMKKLRMELHSICDKIWGAWRYMERKKKQAMYKWLKENAPKPHIAQMTLEDLLSTRELLKKKLDEEREQE